MTTRFRRFARLSASSILAAGALLGVAPAAHAQLGNGWVPYQPSSTIHLDGSNGIETYPGSSTNLMNEGASFTNMGGIETFIMFNPISNRSERRLQNEYSSGRRQFEGEVRVSPPTDDESIMQIFGGTSGATTQMIRAYNVGNGTIRKVPGSVVLASNVYGTWVRINVIHDKGANKVHTYANGRLIVTADGEEPSTNYHKYGSYGTLRTGNCKVEWRNVKHFRDGTPPPPGAPPPPPIDAGTPDTGTAPDLGAPPDAGRDSAPGNATGGNTPSTGGAGATGGAGSVTGGAAGATGGSGGGTGGATSGGGAPTTGGAAPSGARTGGAPPVTDPDTGGASGGHTQDAGCACRLGVTSAAPGRGATIVALATLGLVLRRRRRR